MKQNLLIDFDFSVGNNLDDADDEFKTNDDTIVNNANIYVLYFLL